MKRDNTPKLFTQQMFVLNMVIALRVPLQSTSSEKPSLLCVEST